MFKGSIVALVTPFKDGKLDVEGLKKNIEFLLNNKTAGLVPCGTTGESPTLTEEEWEAVIATTVTTTNKRVPVIAGSGTNSTERSVKLTKRVKELGADGALVVAPYYNKPTQEGIYNHFRTIAESVNIPLVIYNIPSRTGVNILPKTFERLVNDCPNIVAVKEAAGSLDQVTDIVSRCGERLTLLSGDDSLTLPMLSVGGKGVISVVANIVPADVARMIEKFFENNADEAKRIHLKLFPLCKALFVETNPIPIKAAMDLLGMAAGEPRLPLLPPAPENLEFIRKSLKDYGLL
jgi:4-hydroxy-tetrahydrodipicolinate synthase